MSFMTLLVKPEIAALDLDRCPLPELNLREYNSFSNLGSFFRQLCSGAAFSAVYAHLMCARYDIYDIAQMLATTGYSGELIAISEPLPRSEMVLNELRREFPGLRLKIMTEEECRAASETTQASRWAEAPL